MRHTIELSEAGEASLRRLASGGGRAEDEVLQSMLGAMLEGTESTIRSSPEILGGDARIRDTRIPVWLVVAHKKWGDDDAEILRQYPSLVAADLVACWTYYAVNSERVDAERRQNDEAD